MSAISLRGVTKAFDSARAVDNVSFEAAEGRFVGLQVFSSGDQGIDWPVISAATLMTSAPLLIAFLLFQRQFVQSFMRAGIR